MTRSLIQLTWGFLAAGLLVTAGILVFGNPSPDLVGVIVAAWLVNGGIGVAVNFWFGSSAGRGRNLDPENRPTEKQEEQSDV